MSTMAIGNSSIQDTFKSHVRDICAFVSPLSSMKLKVHIEAIEKAYGTELAFSIVHMLYAYAVTRDEQLRANLKDTQVVELDQLLECFWSYRKPLNTKESNKAKIYVINNKHESLEAKNKATDANKKTVTEKEISNSFLNKGEFWIVQYRGRAFHLRSCHGLKHIAYLLSRPHEEIHSLELSAAALNIEGERLTNCSTDIAESLRSDSRHLREICEEMREASEACDVSRLSRLKESFYSTYSKLESELGLVNCSTESSQAAEKARVNVTRAIKLAIRKIANQDSSLAQHLLAINTGRFCSYRPDPSQPIKWVLG